MKKFLKKIMEYFWEWAFFLCTLSLILAGLYQVGELLGDSWGASALFLFIHVISFSKKIDKYKQRYHERASRLLENPAFDKLTIGEHWDISNGIRNLIDNLW